jgi:alcohol dehydrogenase (cytochrome c)
MNAWCKRRLVAVAIVAGAKIALPTALMAREDERERAADVAPTMVALMSQGRQVYSGNCIGCHGPEGEGPVARLAGAKILERKGVVIPKIINGGHMMPPFGNLANTQVAAVATYVRNAFGNAFGVVQASDVADYRLSETASAFRAAVDRYADFVPVTPRTLADPDDGDWLSFRRTQNHWGYSPLSQINRGNVSELRMEWTLGLEPGGWEGTPLVYGGIMYLHQPRDIVVALDATTGDPIWEYRRLLPADLQAKTAGQINMIERTIGIGDDKLVFDTADGYLVAVDVKTGQLAWETRLHDYSAATNISTAGPVIVNGKVLTNRTCLPGAGPEACFIAAHDLATGRELWRTPTIPRPGEAGDETWGGVPYEKRQHIGSWMPPSYDPELNLVFYGTSVTSPYPKFLLGGDVQHGNFLYQTSTLAINPDTGAIVWHYQHLRDHWDIDHPFGRILVDTAVAPNVDAVPWINPKVVPGEIRKVLTGIPGKTGIIYTLDRATGEFLWGRPTTPQNIVVNIKGETGHVETNPDVIPTAANQKFTMCGGYVRSWQEGAYSPRTNTQYFALKRPDCWITWFDDDGPSPGASLLEWQRYYLVDNWHREMAPFSESEKLIGKLNDNSGYIYAVDVATGATKWVRGTGKSPMNSIVATGGGLLFVGDRDRRFRALDQDTGETLWETILGNQVLGYPISYEVAGRQYVAVGVSAGAAHGPAGARNAMYVFALPSTKERD